ncbi:MAG: hypothetical protein EA405_06310 [Rhodospirillales bacterium]|nr:MAG: hypothetical protein EA405_06310 [Rhodospirillales bacterium]
MTAQPASLTAKPGIPGEPHPPFARVAGVRQSREGRSGGRVIHNAYITPRDTTFETRLRLFGPGC